MTQSDSTLSAFEAALAAYAQTGSVAAFDALALLLSPSLFKSSGAFFDQACERAQTAREGSLLPALLRFMDLFCSRGTIAGVDGAPIAEWRSCALLFELVADEDEDDPRHLDNLAPLAVALAEVFMSTPSRVSVAPIAMDLRAAKPCHDMFRFAMLPTQMARVDPAELREANPNGSQAAGPARLARWRALAVSCAFEPGQAPDDLGALVRSAVKDGPAKIPCSYRAGGEERAALLAISDACGPFSSCAHGLDPERAELSRDAELMAKAHGIQAPLLRALAEPVAAPGSALLGPALAPFESFAITVCAPDGTLLDAIELPALPESLALANEVFSKHGIFMGMTVPAEAAWDGEGSRLWATAQGRQTFDIFAWRSRVLGIQDLD